MKIEQLLQAGIVEQSPEVFGTLATDPHLLLVFGSGSYPKTTHTKD